MKYIIQPNLTNEKQINAQFKPTITVIDGYGFHEINKLHILNKPSSVSNINLLTKLIDSKLSKVDKEQPILLKIDYMFQGEKKSFEFKQYLGNNNGSILDNLYKLSKFYTLNPFGKSELQFNSEKQKEQEFIYNFIVPYLAIHMDIQRLEYNTKSQLDKIERHKEIYKDSPLKNSYIKMHTEVLKYLDKCKGILNSGNLEIPYTTPELEKAEKEYSNLRSKEKYYTPFSSNMPSKTIKSELTLTVKHYRSNYKDLENKIEPIKDKTELEKDKIEPIQNKTELEKDKIYPTEVIDDLKNIDKQSDFTPVVISVADKDNYEYRFTPRTELRLDDAYMLTYNRDETLNQDQEKQEKHLISFKIKYVLNGEEKTFKFKQCLGDGSGDFLNNIYLNSSNLKKSTKSFDKDFVYNFFLQYIDTHRILVNTEKEVKLLTRVLNNNKHILFKESFDLNSKLLKETSNYISTCRKMLNSGILEIPSSTPEIDTLDKKLIDLVSSKPSNSHLIWRCEIVDFINKELNTIRFKKQIEPKIQDKALNKIENLNSLVSNKDKEINNNTTNTSMEIKKDDYIKIKEDFKPYITIIKGDGKNLKNDQKISISELYHTIYNTKIFDNISDIKFKVTFLLDKKENELIVTQPMGINIFDNIYDLNNKMSLNKFNLAGYLSTHFALDRIEDLAKRGYQSINLTCKSNKLKTIGNQIDSELIKYVSDCRKILNSGNMNIPLTTPQLHSLIKNYNNVVENLETINNKTGVTYLSFSEDNLIRPFLESVKYNKPLINSLSNEPNQIQDKFFSPTVTIIWSEYRNLKEGDCFKLSQANFMFDKIDKDIYKITKGETYNKVKLSVDYFLDGKMDHFIIKEYLGAGNGNLIEQIKLDFIYNANNPHITKEEREKINDISDFFIPYLEMHCALDDVKTFAEEELCMTNYRAIKDISYLNNLLDYVKDCRAMVNCNDILQLPVMPLPKETEYNNLTNKINKFIEPNNNILITKQNNERIETSKETAKNTNNEKLSLNEKFKVSKEISKSVNSEKPFAKENNKNKSKESER